LRGEVLWCRSKSLGTAQADDVDLCFGEDLRKDQLEKIRPFLFNLFGQPSVWLSHY
jgi:hypothetical protein